MYRRTLLGGNSFSVIERYNSFRSTNVTQVGH